MWWNKLGSTAEVRFQETQCHSPSQKPFHQQCIPISLFQLRVDVVYRCGITCAKVFASHTEAAFDVSHKNLRCTQICCTSGGRLASAYLLDSSNNNNINNVSALVPQNMQFYCCCCCCSLVVHLAVKRWNLLPKHALVPQTRFRKGCVCGFCQNTV